MTHNSPTKPIAAAPGRAVTAGAPIAAPMAAKPRAGRPRPSVIAKPRGPDVDDILNRYGGD
jgi:hypothetical protein